MGKMKEKVVEEQEAMLKQAEEIFADKKVITVRTMIAKTMKEDMIAFVKSIGISALLGSYMLSSDHRQKLQGMGAKPEDYEGLEIVIAEEDVETFSTALNTLDQSIVKRTPEAEAVEEFYKTGVSRKKTLH